MKKTRRTSIIIFISALALLAMLYVISSLKSGYIWSETYVDDGEQPYDLSLFKSVLKSSVEEFEVLEGLYTDTSYLAATNTTLIFVAGYSIIDSSEVSLLARFAQNGNNVFLSSRSAGGILRSLDDCGVSPEKQLTKRIESEKVKLKSGSKSAEISFDVYNKPRIHPWIYISKLNCYDTLGEFEVNHDQYTNLVRKEWGEGEMIIHSTPMVFTNYHLRKESVFDYVNEIIPETKDEKLWYLEPGFEPDFYPSDDGPNITETPLKFILGQPALKWGWYLTLLLTVIYVMNSMRRKERSIPVLKLPENQNAAYLEMIYGLFRKEGNHKDIILSQTKLLQAYLKNKYGLNAYKPTQEFFQEASVKLKLDKNYIEQFFKKLERYKHNSTLNDADLIKIDKELTEFYLRCP
ncbi:MAG: hypothetical protein MK086_08645 [Flavobacteriales bacterium]|nr:hypothetical protein [Flavobacteriales bacterium]